MLTDLFADEPEEDFTFENKDLSAEPTFNFFDIREVAFTQEGQDVIWDSGALENVMGNRYSLHEFKTLASPISVRVATDGPCNYITGTGALRFFRTNKTIIAVKNVYYCENSWSTILSIEAFKKFDAHFQVGHNLDTIDLISKCRNLLIRSVFNQNTNPWLVNRPLRAPVPLSSTNVHCSVLVCNEIEMKSVFKSSKNVESSQFT
jgi:hypothetical protein